MEILTMDQGSEEWHQARAGLITASNFKSVLSGSTGKGEGKMRDAYMRKLAAERITGKPIEGYKNAFMDRGNEMEPIAISDFQIDYGLPDESFPKIGLVINTFGSIQIGASPDRLIGEDGGFEQKTMKGDTFIEMKEMADRTPGWYPTEHRAQIQGSMWVCERRWWMLNIFSPGMKKFRIRIVRDDQYIEALHRAVRDFHEDLAAMVRRHNPRSENA